LLGILLTKRNFGNRSIGANGSKEQQYTGILGETVIYDIVYVNYPSITKRGSVDIVINGKKIDIKTMGRTVYMKEITFTTLWVIKKNFPNDIYIFNSIVKNETNHSNMWLVTERRIFYEV
jgi:hypothetical protein